MSIVLLPVVLLGVSVILLSLWLGNNLPFSFKILNPILLLIIFPIYFVVLNTGNQQATIGKRVCNIYVGKSHDSSPINKIQALGRLLFFELCVGLKFLCNYSINNEMTQPTPFMFLVFYAISVVFFLMAGVTKEKTTLYDLLFKTRVFVGSPLNPSSIVGKGNHYLVLSILLVIWGCTIPLFKSGGIGYLALYILLALGVFQVGMVIYQKNIHHEKQESIHYSFKHIKLLIISMIPTVILLILAYGIELYIKVATS